MTPAAHPSMIPQHASFGLIALLLFLHMISQMDQQMVAAFAPDIMRDLELSRSQFALVAGLAFSSFYALTAIVAGMLADRIGRVPVLTVGVGIWSLFTGLAGMAQGFWSLLAAPPFVATGEATLVPTATNIILARTPDKFKASAIGLFFAGMVASIMFITSIYRPIFSVIERELPLGLKATSTGLNMLALNLLMMGGLSLAIGALSEVLAKAGWANSWTIPMLGADAIALGSISLLWLASRPSLSPKGSRMSPNDNSGARLVV